MNLYVFNGLDELEQHEELWKHGVHIGLREEGKYRIVLFQIHLFYIELYYHMKFNALHRFRNFSSTEGCDVYMDKFNIIFKYTEFINAFGAF